VADILSERDVAVALPQQGGALRETIVSEIMTVDVGFCSPEMSVRSLSSQWSLVESPISRSQTGTSYAVLSGYAASLAIGSAASSKTLTPLF